MYLELAPAINALRSRPEEFEFSHDTLHHLPSRHRFRFQSEDDVRIEALCDCSMLRAKPEQATALHAAYREWPSDCWRCCRKRDCTWPRVASTISRSPTRTNSPHWSPRTCDERRGGRNLR